MKKKIPFWLAIIGLVLILSGVQSCEKSPDNPSQPLAFIIGSQGKGELQRGLYKYTPGEDPVMITSLYPYNYNSWYADQNSGIIAFALSSNIIGNTSGIVYMHTDRLEDIMYLPVPPAPNGFYYSVNSTTPRVLSDGRIAYLVSLHTDDSYDNWFAGMVAIFNPTDESIELSGDPSGFVLSQPEKGNDTEDGTMKKGFVVSPDNKYIYCELYGYGTDFGTVHRDYSFIARYSIGTPGSYERLTQMEALPAGVTGDGRFLLLADGAFGTKKYDLSSGIITQVSEVYLAPASGQISKTSSKLLRSWIAFGDTGAGFGELNLNTSPPGWLHLIDEDEITSPKNYYSSLALGVQYSTDESLIYFGVHRSSAQGKYIDICSTSRIELNEEPKILGSISSDFDMNVLIHIND